MRWASEVHEKGPLPILPSFPPSLPPSLSDQGFAEAIALSAFTEQTADPPSLPPSLPPYLLRVGGDHYVVKVQLCLHEMHGRHVHLAREGGREGGREGEEGEDN